MTIHQICVNSWIIPGAFRFFLVLHADGLIRQKLDISLRLDLLLMFTRTCNNPGSMTLRPKTIVLGTGNTTFCCSGLFWTILEQTFFLCRRLFWIGWTTGITYTYLNFPVILIIKGDFPEGGHNFGKKHFTIFPQIFQGQPRAEYAAL